MEPLNISLYSNNADEILISMVNSPMRHDLHLFPNLPLVRAMVKPFIVKSNIFWLLTYNLPGEVFDLLEEKRLAPFYGYGETYQHFENIYYGKDKEN